MYVNVLLAVLWAVGLESRGLWQAACLGSFGAGAVLVLITYSRGSWLILAGTTALIAGALSVLRWKRRKLLVLLPAACAPLFVLVLKADSLLGRWGTGMRELGGDSYATARGLGPALAMIGDYPFAGVGLNHMCFMLENRHYGDDMDPYERQVIHNVYVTTAAETGLVGAGLLVLAVLWFLASGVRTAWRVRHSPFALALAVGATAGMLSVAVHSLSEWVARIVVILQAQGTMAAVLVSLDRRALRPSDLTTERHRLVLLHSPACTHSRHCPTSHSSPAIA
jgi:O-antigen ligase